MIRKYIKRIWSYQKGINLYNKGMYQKAIDIFINIIKENPTSNNVHARLSRYYYGRSQYNIGMLLFTLGNYIDAVYAFEEAIVYNPNNFVIYEYIGICYNNIGKFNKAAKAFENIISKEPACLPLKLKLGITFQNLKMWDKSESICREILNIYPDYANVWFYTGLNLLGKEENAQAIKAFEKALKINPQYKDAHIRLAITHVNMKNFYDAFFHISLLMEENPDYPDLNYFAGIIYTGCKKFDMAIEAFEKELEINPSFTEVRIKLGMLYHKTGNTDKAAQTLQSCCELETDNKKAKAILDFITRSNSGENTEQDIELLTQSIERFNSLVEIKPNFSEMISIVKTLPDEDTSIYEKLLPVITESVEQNPQYPDIHCSLGSLYFKLKKYEDAKSSFIKALEINPDYVQARIYYFKTLEKQKKFNQALVQGKWLLEKDIPYPDVYCTLGKVYFHLNMLDQADDIINKTLEKNPNYAYAWLVLAKIQINSGKTDTAVVSLQKCLTLNPSEFIEREAEKTLLRIKKLIP